MAVLKKQKSQTTTKSSLKWFVLRGFKIDNKDETGFLAIGKARKDSTYTIVEDVDDAMKFPSENVYRLQGFGTPKQWLEFFKGEPELEDWKFHLVKVNGPRVNIDNRL